MAKLIQEVIQMPYAIKYPLQSFHALLSAILIAKKEIHSKLIEYEFNQYNLLLNRDYIQNSPSERQKKSMQIQEYENALLSYKKNIEIYNRLFRRIEMLRKNIAREFDERNTQHIFEREILLNISEEELQSILEALDIAKNFILRQSENMEEDLKSITKEKQKTDLLQEIQKNQIRFQNFVFLENYMRRLPVLNSIIHPTLVSCLQDGKERFTLTWYFDIREGMKYAAQYSYHLKTFQWTLRSLLHQDIGYCPLCENHCTGSANTDICYLDKQKSHRIYIEKEILEILLKHGKNELPEQEQRILSASGILEKMYFK